MAALGATEELIPTHQIVLQPWHKSFIRFHHLGPCRSFRKPSKRLLHRSRTFLHNYSPSFHLLCRVCKMSLLRALEATAGPKPSECQNPFQAKLVSAKPIQGSALTITRTTSCLYGPMASTSVAVATSTNTCSIATRTFSFISSTTRHYLITGIKPLTPLFVFYTLRIPNLVINKGK